MYCNHFGAFRFFFFFFLILLIVAIIVVGLFAPNSNI